MENAKVLNPVLKIQSALLGWEKSLRQSIHKQPALQLPFLAALPIFFLTAAIIGPFVMVQNAPNWLAMGFSLPADASVENLLLSINDPYSLPEAVTDTSAGLEAEEIQEIFLPVSFKEHSLGSGESLSGLSLEYNVQVGTIISWNEIRNARRLPAGVDLEIPSYDGVRYTVKRGDSLSSIAQARAVDYNAILDANNMDSPVVTPGQTLFLPGASMTRTELRSAMGELFIFPTQGRLSSRYGWRRDPFTGIRSFHNGIDLANRVGTPVRASMEGTVSDVGYHSGYGNYVVIRHSGGYQTLYGHLQSYSIRKGQSVAQGQVIARMGSTGYSTGSHLHFTVFLRNKDIDPMRVLY